MCVTLDLDIDMFIHGPPRNAPEATFALCENLQTHTKILTFSLGALSGTFCIGPWRLAKSTKQSRKTLNKEHAINYRCPMRRILPGRNWRGVLRNLMTLLVTRICGLICTIYFISENFRNFILLVHTCTGFGKIIDHG